ncbi:acyl-CoA dehydrogenase family protein [Rhizobium paknamense]|uniref:Acyl-CoA dehydrogenase/oxidase N-terminal domain-containing protein n=1 Tax=Rhizobium paknamense TaxID=1206817 RepID=A0ABU0IGF9_9HYPH|nr:acyl-CoA dehydrogenase family protein [Rhizobium paknamense]MDQ0457302.1 hypothetical protein [Rhizobium paknamense]
MGTITHLHERLRPAPSHVGSEDDALHRAAEIAARGLASRRQLRDELSQAGLLGVSIPADFAGLDVSNGVLAEIVASLSAKGDDGAAVLIGHQAALEALRNSGSEEQRRVLFARVAAGESFHLIETASTLKLAADALGSRLDDLQSLAGHGSEADWLAVFAHNEAGGECLAVFSRQDLLAAQEPGQMPGLHVSVDGVLPCRAGARAMSEVMRRFLQGAVVQGRARAGGFQSAIPHYDGLSQARFVLEKESLAALLERCGLAIDAAQVNPGPQTIEAAAMAALILQAAAERMFTVLGLEVSGQPALNALASRLEPGRH